MIDQAKERPVVPNEEVVVQRAINGDREAFGEIYECFRDGIYGYAIACTHDSEEAADLTSEVFLNALDKIEGFEQRGIPIWDWFITITRRQVVNYQRSRQQSQGHESYSRELSKDKDLSPPLLNLISTDSVSGEGLEQQMVLREALGKLSGKKGQILIERFINDQKSADIAARLEKSDVAVRVTQKRALKEMRELVGDYFTSDEPQFPVSWTSN